MADPQVEQKAKRKRHRKQSEFLHILANCVLCDEPGGAPAELFVTCAHAEPPAATPAAANGDAEERPAKPAQQDDAPAAKKVSSRPYVSQVHAQRPPRSWFTMPTARLLHRSSRLSKGQCCTLQQTQPMHQKSPAARAMTMTPPRSRAVASSVSRRTSQAS